jgi:hypothetical protein
VAASFLPPEPVSDPSKIRPPLLWYLAFDNDRDRKLSAASAVLMAGAAQPDPAERLFNPLVDTRFVTSGVTVVRRLREFCLNFDDRMEL